MSLLIREPFTELRSINCRRIKGNGKRGVVEKILGGMGCVRQFKLFQRFLIDNGQFISISFLKTLFAGKRTLLLQASLLAIWVVLIIVMILLKHPTRYQRIFCFLAKGETAKR